MVQRAQLVEDTMAKVEGMRGKDNSKPVFVKKGAPNIAPTFRNNNVNNNNKRPNVGRDVAGDKRVKVEGRQLAENCKFCDKPGHRAEECWKKLGACLKCGGRDHRIPNCPMLKDQPGTSFRTCWGLVEELLVAGELWINHKKLIFFPLFRLLRLVQTDLLDSTKGGRDSRAWYRTAQRRRDPMKVVCNPGCDFDVDPSTARVGDYEVQEEEQIEDGNASE
ncbi:hypothetical protein Taro_002126 [Colocasia esculenta]|uniref:CCHC-type domain-containing protein n=1 Tax=Colocasia esculenta TaxID=4460 RepID=A0A843TMN2_COLES|nr:hypothetical protein [Colocasia esculenta]